MLGSVKSGFPSANAHEFPECYVDLSRKLEMINLKREPSGKAFVYGDANLELPARHLHQSIVKVLTAINVDL